MVERGPGRGRDVPVGRGLLQLHRLLLLQDQQAEEDGAHTRTSAPLTYRLEAERIGALVLEHTHSRRPKVP